MNASGEFCRVALFWAMCVCHSDVVLVLLIRDGVDLNIQNNDGVTTLTGARHNNNDTIVRLLQEHIRLERKKRL